MLTVLVAIGERRSANVICEAIDSSRERGEDGQREGKVAREMGATENWWLGREGEGVDTGICLNKQRDRPREGGE